MTSEDREELERQTAMIRRYIAHSNPGEEASLSWNIATLFDQYLTKSMVGILPTGNAGHVYFVHWAFIVSLPLSLGDAVQQAWMKLRSKELGITEGVQP